MSFYMLFDLADITPGYWLWCSNG